MFTKLISMVGVKGILAAAALGITPTAALARHHDDIHIDFDFRFGHPHISVVDCPPPAPVYEQREVRVYVDPVYRTVCDRQWIAPEYRTVCERVWVPDQFGIRDVVRCDAYGRRIVYRERVLLQTAHYQDVQRQEIVCEGHWQNVDRQELVMPGHWETQLQTVAVNSVPYPR